MRCWHSNTNYTWNITPTHKNSLLSYVRWDPCWCLLSFAFFPFTNLAQRRPDIPGPRSLSRRRASSTVFHWGNAAVCLVLSLNLSAPLIACDICFIYIFRRGGSRSAIGSFHTVERWSRPLEEIIDERQTSPSSLPLWFYITCPRSDPRLIILLLQPWFVKSYWSAAVPKVLDSRKHTHICYFDFLHHNVMAALCTGCERVLLLKCCCYSCSRV